MNLVRGVVLTALTCLAAVTCSAQAPAGIKKLSPDEMLGLSVAECSTYEEGDEPDECVRLSNTTAQALLFDSLSWLKIPSGIALPPGDAGDTRFTFRPRDLSVRGILDSIVVADRRYEWRIEGGVVNLLPKAGLPPLLDVRLTEFRREGVPMKVIFEALESMPEVRRRAAELGFNEPPGGFRVQIGLIDPRKFTVRCRGCTVREVLNTVARQGGSSWMYREYHYEGKKAYHFL